MIDSSKYRVHFLNQYVRIPEKVSDALQALYPAKYEGVRHCIALIIINLLASDEVAYSRNNNFYTDNHTQHYTYANMRRALELSLAAGYAVRRRTGYQAYKQHYSSTLGAGKRLADFGEAKEMELDVESLPLLTINGKPIFSEEDLKTFRARDAQLNLESLTLSGRLERIYDEALKLNKDYWNNIAIDASETVSDQKCFNRVGLTRIFKDGGVGRWFQKGEMSYQQLPKEDRARLRLNGERVTEIDYSAIHPHILYAWEKKQCPDDFYQGIMDECGCDRFVAKNITLIAINAGSYRSLVGAINLNKTETERANRSRDIPEPILYNELKKNELTPKKVVEAIGTAHPAIEKYTYSASANKLMLVESDIMTSVLLKLMRLDISALPVHDSVIVPSRQEDIARRVMQNTYKEHTGFSVVIK